MKTREQERTDAIIGVLMIVLVVLVVYASFVFGTSRLPDTDPNARPTTTTVQPQEDEPGWDCRIHGNKVCGPGY